MIAKPKGGKNVPDPLRTFMRFSGTATGSRGREGVGPQVVHLTLFGVGEDLVGLGDLLELLLRLRVGVDVRVQLAGEPPVGLLDLIRRCVPADAR